MVYKVGDEVWCVCTYPRVPVASKVLSLGSLLTVYYNHTYDHSCGAHVAWVRPEWCFKTKAAAEAVIKVLDGTLALTGDTICK